MTPIEIFVVFCPERLAIVLISGIITTNLGKAATLTEIAGRKKTDTSLQDMPFSLTGEGYFFWPVYFEQKILTHSITMIYCDFYHRTDQFVQPVPRPDTAGMS
jgi:hypothetical protein